MYQEHIALLNQIKDRLTNVGWRRGANYNNSYDKPCCLLQTMDAVIKFSSDPRAYKIICDIEDIMREFITAEDTDNKFAISPNDEICFSSITNWNDWEHRKFSHVLKLVDQTLSYYYSEASVS
jgi:hypothetical protein